MDDETSARLRESEMKRILDKKHAGLRLTDKEMQFFEMALKQIEDEVSRSDAECEKINAMISTIPSRDKRIEYWTSYLNSIDLNIRTLAIFGLIDEKAVEVKKGLLPLLHDKNRLVLTAAIQAIGELCTPEDDWAIERLVDLLKFSIEEMGGQKKLDFVIQKEAAWALGDLQAVSAMSSLVSLYVAITARENEYKEDLSEFKKSIAYGLNGIYESGKLGEENIIQLSCLLEVSYSYKDEKISEAAKKELLRIADELENTSHKGAFGIGSSLIRLHKKDEAFEQALLGTLCEIDKKTAIEGLEEALIEWRRHGNDMEMPLGIVANAINKIAPEPSERIRLLREQINSTEPGNRKYALELICRICKDQGDEIFKILRDRIPLENDSGVFAELIRKLAEFGPIEIISDYTELLYFKKDGSKQRQDVLALSDANIFCRSLLEKEWNRNVWTMISGSIDLLIKREPGANCLDALLLLAKEKKHALERLEKIIETPDLRYTDAQLKKMVGLVGGNGVIATAIGRIIRGMEKENGKQVVRYMLEAYENGKIDHSEWSIGKTTFQKALVEGGEAAREYLEGCISEKKGDVRCTFAIALGAFPPKDLKKLQQTLFDAMKEATFINASKISEAFKNSVTSEVLLDPDELAEFIGNMEKPEETRRRAMEALCRADNKKAVKTMVTLLANESRIAEYAKDILYESKIINLTANELLLNAEDKTSEEVKRVAAIREIWACRAELKERKKDCAQVEYELQEIDYRVLRLISDELGAVRMQAAKTALKIGIKNTGDYSSSIIDLLSNPDKKTVCEAVMLAMSLGMFGEEKVKAATFEILEEWGGEEAKEVLNHGLKCEIAELLPTAIKYLDTPAERPWVTEGLIGFKEAAIGPLYEAALKGIIGLERAQRIINRLSPSTDNGMVEVSEKPADMVKRVPASGFERDLLGSGIQREIGRCVIRGC